MVSSTNSAFDLTVQNTASSPYALKVMTVVAAVFLPLVLLYQGWTYYVFRARVRTEDFAVADERGPRRRAAPRPVSRPPA